MRNPTKYFVWNKESDFAGGSLYNASLLSPGITVRDAGQGDGYYFSRLLDSREKQTQWHRLLVEEDAENETSISFWIYAAEERTVIKDGMSRDIGEILKDETVPWEEKQRLFRPYCRKYADDPKDILLHEVKGRYLWFGIRLAAQGGVSPNIRKIKVCFPKDTWLSYLPEIYQQDQKSASFVERYLGIFQSLHQDMTEQIRKAPGYLDVDAAEGPFVEWLASWISVEDSYIWSEEQLKYLLRHGMELYRIRGTAGYLRRMVKLYTGRDPYIVEYHQIAPFFGRQDYADKLTGLYGTNSYVFTVIVDAKAKITRKEYQILLRIIERARPAHMECNVVALEPFIFLDQHSYMGINSVLGSYSALVLNGQASIPFTTLSEKGEPK